MTQDNKNYDLSQKQLYKKLSYLYESNGYYERNFYTDPNFHSFHDKHIKPLRTVVNRSVEFYTSKLSASMQISADDQAVIDAISQVYTWSNFSANKPVALRQLSLYGNLFWKILTDGEKVWFETIDPKYVTDLTVDKRGYIQTIRLDIPITNENGKALTYTEYWTKEYFSIWHHGLGESTPLDQLGNPVNSGWLVDMGIDFVPFVHCKFKDIGSKYGVGSVFHCLDKIDESNKEASRLSDLVFRYMKHLTVVSSNNTDPNGRPIPAPKIKDDKDPWKDEDDSVLSLPGMATVNSLVPNLNYDSFLSVLNASMEELNNDLPELRYYSIKDGSMSGKAIRSILSGAVDRAEEAKNNFIQALIRANQIALSLGKFWGIFNLSGSYEDGGFDHQIITPELFPMSEDEKATTLKSYTDAGLALPTALRIVGYDESFIKTALEEKANQESSSLDLANKSLGTALTQFNTGG